MGDIIRFICLAIFLGLIGKGTGQCGPRNITVREVATGARYNDKPEWAVSIINDCQCTQNRFVLDCPGFQFAKMVKPPNIVFRPNETFCYISQPIPPHSSINFTYVYDIMVIFKPLQSSTLTCP